MGITALQPIEVLSGQVTLTEAANPIVVPFGRLTYLLTYLLPDLCSPEVSL